MITAIFKMGDFTAKRKIHGVVHQYLIPLRERLYRIIPSDISATTVKTEAGKVLVFEWRKQIGKRTHEYWFKEIV